MKTVYAIGWNDYTVANLNEYATLEEAKKAYEEELKRCAYEKFDDYCKEHDFEPSEYDFEKYAISLEFVKLELDEEDNEVMNEEEIEKTVFWNKYA